MITEDYVSFETAKLLKENGYKGLFNSYYNGAGYVVDRPNVLLKEPEYQYYERVSLYMAMKWLREIHKLYIEVSLSCDREDKNAKIFDASIFNVQNQRYKKLSNIYGYEETCESAIKYCLENLI